MSDTDTEVYIDHPTTLDAMKAVMREIGVIAKTRRSEAGGNYMFRGIEELLEALAPVARRHGLLSTTHVGTPIISTYQAGSGGRTTMNHVILPVEVHFAGGTDGSVIVSDGLGEAADSGDKAVSKAYSVGYREIMFKTFVVPTRGDDYDTEREDATRASAAEMAEQAEAAELARLESLGWSGPDERDAAWNDLKEWVKGDDPASEWARAWVKARKITKRVLSASQYQDLAEAMAHADASTGEWADGYDAPDIEP